MLTLGECHTHTRRVVPSSTFDEADVTPVSPNHTDHGVFVGHTGLVGTSDRNGQQAPLKRKDAWV